jgi:hypothetical protein
MDSTLRLLLCWAFAMAVCLMIPSGQAHAGNLDGSTPLICAFTRALECDSATGCEAADLEDLEMPRFFRVDFKNSSIVSVGILEEGVKKETPIKVFQRQDGKLLLQGFEVRGWSMVITEKTGKMTFTASGDDEGFVLFGACMAQ